MKVAEEEKGSWRLRNRLPGNAPAPSRIRRTMFTTPAQAFGKIMSLTKPRLAVCYHFQSDHDTSVAVYSEIRKTYSGPLNLAQDFTVWNVTKDDIKTRMAMSNHESFPTPPQKKKQPPDSALNKRNGTDVKPGLTGIPFMKKQSE